MFVTLIPRLGLTVKTPGSTTRSAPKCTDQKSGVCASGMDYPREDRDFWAASRVLRGPITDFPTTRTFHLAPGARDLTTAP